MDFGFIGPAYTSRSVNANAQKCINLYPEVDESGSGKNNVVLYGTPGLATFITLPKTPIRALWAGDDRLFAVAGDTLYEVSSGGGILDTRVGTLAVDSNPAQIFPNGTQLLIVSGGNAYCDNGGVGGGPVQCVDEVPENVTARSGVFLDGYFIVNPPDSGQIRLSALNNGLSWDSSDVQTAEAYADHIQRLLSDHQELWLLGKKTTEVWRNEGDPDTPFRRDPGGFIHQGIVASWSAVNLPNGPGWLGGDARGQCIAWAAQGFQPVRVSTHAVEHAWNGYSDVSDCRGWTYTQHGHHFWVLNFPTGNATWVYDLNTKLWHERAYGANRHRGVNHAFVFGKHFVGDHTSGIIYEMDLDLYTDQGAAITRTRTAPHISEEQLRVFYAQLQLDVEVGEIATPEFDLEWSDDGGHTWSTAVTHTAGGASDYTHRVIWRRLGQSRDRVFRVTSTEPMRHAWINAYLKASGGTS